MVREAYTIREGHDGKMIFSASTGEAHYLEELLGDCDIAVGDVVEVLSYVGMLIIKKSPSSLDRLKI